MTIARSGATPSSRAAVRNISGSGFPWAKSRPETSTSKKSSSVRPRRRDPDTGVLDGDDEPQRVRVRGEVPGLDEPHYHLLLALGVHREARVVVGDVEVLQRRARAAQARFARHLLLVDLRRERLRRPGRPVADVAPLALHQLAQRLAPCLLVWRVDKHAVDIEDRSLERRHTPS